MKKHTILLLLLALIAIFAHQTITMPDGEESAKIMQNHLTDQNFNTLSVEHINSGEVLVMTRDEALIKQFLDNIIFNEDVGTVMSAGTYRFILSQNSVVTETFQLVAGEYLRIEGGHDYRLTTTSSKAIQTWIENYE